MINQNKNKYHKALEWLLSAITLIFLLVVYVEVPSEINYQPLCPDAIRTIDPLDFLDEDGLQDYVTL